MGNTGSTTESAGWGTNKRWSSLRVVARYLAVLTAVCMVATKGLAIGQVEREEAKRLDITVRLYTFTPLPPGDLAAAEREASTIFQRTGVEVKWPNCPQTAPKTQEPSCQTPNAPTEIFLRVVSDFLEDAQVPKSAMGYAVPTATPHHGYVAGIALERARRQLLDGPKLTLGQLLGHGIAHEIGHLLLGTNSHSPSGLTFANWGAKELRLASRGQLNFSAWQADTIRADVQARSGEQSSR